MTVAELIAHLQTFPASANVVISVNWGEYVYPLETKGTYEEALDRGPSGFRHTEQVVFYD